MQVKEYIKQVGMQKIAEICDFNLRNIKNHLLRECDIAKKSQLYYIIKQFKEYFWSEQKLNLKSKGLIDEITSKSI